MTIRDMRLGILAVLIALAVAAASAQSTPAPGQSTPLPKSGAAKWCRFVWDSAKLPGNVTLPKAALLVPVRIPHDSRTYYMQLDTGASTVFYERAYLELVNKSGSAITSTSFNGRIADHEVVNHPVQLDKGRGHDDPLAKEGRAVIGTLGMDFFARHSLTIDFPEQRLLILDWEDVPEKYVRREMTFVHGGYRDDKFYVVLEIAGKTYKDEFFFDTGASSTPLGTHEKLWRTLTGRTGTEPDNVVWRAAHSWGRKIDFVGAPVQGSVKIGSVAFENPLVFYTPGGEFDFTKAESRMTGLFGNALFFDRIVIVDPNRWRFGISD